MYIEDNWWIICAQSYFEGLTFIENRLVLSSLRPGSPHTSLYYNIIIRVPEKWRGNGWFDIHCRIFVTLHNNFNLANTHKKKENCRESDAEKTVSTTILQYWPTPYYMNRNHGYAFFSIGIPLTVLWLVERSPRSNHVEPHR